MQIEIMKAHREALNNWARVYEQMGIEGAGEAGFLMRRTERQIGRIMGDASVEPEPRKSEEPVTEPAAG